jgi:hypothetical protein
MKYIIHNRLEYYSQTTIGELLIDGNRFCYTLEDTCRPEGIKVTGETAISYNIDEGYKVAIRPHPVYSNIELINNIFSNLIVEKTSINIQHSVLRTNAVISLYSTVNRQAYNNDVKYIIDDISDPQRYKRLKDLQYYFIKDKYSVLSTYIDISLY